MLDLHRLRMLRELQGRGTVRAAAAALGYTPGAVSQQLAVLEREAGTALFERVGRNLRLTAAGEALAVHGAHLLDAAEAAEEEIATIAAGRLTGTVRVAAFQSAFLHVLTPAIAELGRTHPGIRVEAVEAEVEDAAPAVALNRLDVAIGDEYTGQPREIVSGLRRQRLLEESLHLVLPARDLDAEHANAQLPGLGQMPWAACRMGTGQHRMSLRVCRELGRFEPDIRYQSDDFQILLELVRTAGTAAILPGLVLHNHTPGLFAKPLSGSSYAREVFLLTRADPTPASSAVSQAIRSAASRLGAPM